MNGIHGESSRKNIKQHVQSTKVLALAVAIVADRKVVLDFGFDFATLRPSLVSLCSQVSASLLCQGLGCCRKLAAIQVRISKWSRVL